MYASDDDEGLRMADHKELKRSDDDGAQNSGEWQKGGYYAEEHYLHDATQQTCAGKKIKERNPKPLVRKGSESQFDFATAYLDVTLSHFSVSILLLSGPGLG